jgi:hypothetical protein
MSPERSQRPITIEEIILDAKEIMLRDGHHVPILIIVGNKNSAAGQIPDLPETHEERLKLMHTFGQAVANSGRIDQLRQVFMVTEGWMSTPSRDEQTEIRPSEDPDRKEVLIISAIQMTEYKKLLKVFEIVRDQHEQVVGFEEFLSEEKKKDESVNIPLLDVFVQGFQEAFRAKFN